jgi:hypothetical protein
MSFLQDHPRFLETAYDLTRAVLAPFRRWLRPGGGTEKVFVVGERLTKGPVFDCRMCGQCVLHSTGMTCPMTCPKTMRNGPCGGVRPDGHCEVRPEMMCVWLLAWERAGKMTGYGDEIRRILPPLDRRREDTSAWINDLSGANRAPAGWDEGSLPGTQISPSSTQSPL